MPEPTVTGCDGSVTASVTGQTAISESTVTGVTGIKSYIYREGATAIASFIESYMVMGVTGVTAVTLWVFHTWMLDAADMTPYIHILAPQKESGKTTLMDVLACLAARPLPTSHVTAAGLRRALNEQPPFTLFFDEMDPVFHKRGEDTAELRSVLNAGFRRGAQALVNVHTKGDWHLEAFNVFSPKVLVSIGKLPNTIESRSIPILLERKTSGERRRRFRQHEAELEATEIQLMLRSMDYADLPKNPPVPEELSGRQADIWEPLLAIADWLGGEWPARARIAAVELHSVQEDEDEGASLLRHLHEIFGQSEAPALYSSDLVEMLLENEEWPYQRIVEGGRPLDTMKLAAMLKPFGIKPFAMRLYQENPSQKRGYYRHSFEDAWNRYL